MTSAPPIMFFALLIVLAIFLNGFSRRTLVVVNKIALDVSVVLFCISLMGGLRVMSDPSALGPVFGGALFGFFCGLTIKLITSALLNDTDQGDSSQRTKPIWIRAGAVGVFSIGVLSMFQESAGIAAFISPSAFLGVSSVAIAISFALARIDVDRIVALVDYLPVIGFVPFVWGAIEAFHATEPSAIGPITATMILGLLYSYLARAMAFIACSEQTLPKRPHMADAFYSFLPIITLFVFLLVLWIS